ncbi:GAF domain-containing protein [Promineifilum sp.]|uniref:sensor histidine kinase n=1 Tax=Promineifilum sp. TaxID=2664178 RepID=UPI0035AE7DC9
MTPATEIATQLSRERSHYIAELLRTDQTLRKQTDRLRYLQAVHLSILSAESLPAIMDVSIQLLGSLLPSLSTSIVLYHLERGEFEFLKSDWPQFKTGVRHPIHMWDMVTHLSQGEVHYIPDIQATHADTPTLEAAITIGSRSFLCVPLLYRGQLIGSFSLTMAEVHEFPPEELAIVREIANSVAVALQHQRLLEAERQSRERETTLREVAASLTMGLDLNELLQRILDQLERVASCQSSTIWLLENDRPVIAAQRGTASTPEEERNLLNAEPRSLMSVLRSAQPRIINDTTGSPDWVPMPRLINIRSWMGVPLVVKGVCIGALTLDRDRPNAFTVQEMDLALAFANQAAIAIENARLFNQEQRQAVRLAEMVRERTRELETLYGITAATIENPDLSSVLQRSLELTIRAFRCPAGAIYLTNVDPASHPAAWLGDREGLVRALLQLTADHPLLTMPLLNGGPRCSCGGEMPADLAEQGAGGYAVAPLRSRDRNLGVLVLLCNHANCFDESALPLLSAIADQIGAAVENIDLRQKTRQAAIIEERERLSRDLHDAVTQTIYSLSLFAEAARESARSADMDKVERHVQTILQMSQQALGELRLLLFEMRTEALARQGLAGALRERLQSVEKRAGIHVRSHIEDVGPLPVALEEAFYRIGLEALNNSLHHARAARVDVTLLARRGELRLTVRDNGVGFTLNGNGGGLGLESMRNRIDKVGGTLTLTSTPGHGTRVEAHAPL